MVQKTSPFVEGKYGWDFGESGWNLDMDENLLKFSFLFDRNIDGIVETLPPAVNGRAYYLTTDRRVYFAIGGSYYSTPLPKWFNVLERISGATWQFNGTGLEQVPDQATIGQNLDSLNIFTSSLGYSNQGDYTGGLVLSERNDYVTVSAEISGTEDALYKPASGTILPLTLTGTWATDKANLVLLGEDVLRQELAAAGGAAMVGYLSGSVQDALAGLVSSKSFGVVGDGLVDDTVAMLNAMAYCRSNTKILSVIGTPRFVAASVPAGDKTAGYGGDVVLGSSMTGGTLNAAILIEGPIGFDLSEIPTVVERLEFVTTGFEIQESGSEIAFPTILQSESITPKTYAIYRDLQFRHQVSVDDGSVRGPSFIREHNFLTASVERVAFENTLMGADLKNGSRLEISSIYTKNVQTGIYLRSIDSYSVSDVFLTNTQAQSTRWVGRTATPARSNAGLDALLCENCNRGNVSGIDAVRPIERAAYIQSSNLVLSDSKVLNGDGFKVVGTSRDNPLVNAFISDVHLTLDDDFVLGSINPSCIYTYFAQHVDITDCTLTQSSTSQQSRALVSIDGFPYTNRNISLNNCRATHAGNLVYIGMMSQTAAELDAIDPAQTFLVVSGLRITDCYLKKNANGLNGSLFSLRDTNASADAKLTYAVADVEMDGNQVDLSSSGRDAWIFDRRYVNGAKSRNTKVNTHFSGTFPPAVSQPSANIEMDERGLFSAATVRAAQIISGLSGQSGLQGSVLSFQGLESGIALSRVTLTLTKDGTYADGDIELSYKGKGAYVQTGGAVNGSIEVDTGTGLYLGKISGGALTHVLGTPPLTITVSASNVEVRGDLSATLKYDVKIKVA